MRIFVFLNLDFDSIKDIDLLRPVNLIFKVNAFERFLTKLVIIIQYYRHKMRSYEL